MDTLARGRRDDFRGQQLAGRADTVRGVHWDGWQRRYRVIVGYDHLTLRTMHGHLTKEHRTEDLVPIEAWL